ncbi:glycosyltransferase family 8 protein [Hymenobacter sp. DG01]|uniref:glycosyltransferase family 8 protein n=1 Tax=Hymenobacter sp. DG01 TaxID=2584940 RepID=UPI0011246AA5|nr:glycosyltransferase family 8 protein [Hymenobacter sp. DG01]
MKIHIALAFDENYISQFYAVAASVFSNNANNRIEFHAIVSGLDSVCKSNIQNYVEQNNSSICFYSVPRNFGQNFRLDGNWTAATYYRLLFPSLLPKEIERYIYIDSDTIVVGDLSKLALVDVSGHVLAAVRDRLIPVRADLEIYDPYSYFNAGVLYINRVLWEEYKITSRAIDFLVSSPEKVLYADQDALNYILKGNWIRLDIKFNLMYADIPENLPKSEFKQFLEDKIIIHFTQHRPWNLLCENRFRYLYHEYLRKTPGILESSKNKYNKDFKLPILKKLAYIRMREMYFDYPLLGVLWRKIKSL